MKRGYACLKHSKCMVAAFGPPPVPWNTEFFSWGIASELLRVNIGMGSSYRIARAILYDAATPLNKMKFLHNQL